METCNSNSGIVTSNQEGLKMHILRAALLSVGVKSTGYSSRNARSPSRSNRPDGSIRSSRTPAR